MKIGRLVKTAVKYAPVAYPIIRKAMQKRKGSQQSDNTETRTRSTKR